MSTSTNLQLVTEGFNKLVNALAPYIAQEFIKTYGNDNWWREGVLNKLFEDQKRNLPLSGDFATLVGSLDVACCLLLLDIQWHEVFRKTLPRDCKNYVMELKGTRNAWAHAGSQGISDSDTWRALDTMSRLTEHIDPETAQDINELLRTARYGSAEGSTAVTSSGAAVREKTLEQTKAAHGLPSWREVMEPHMDVAEGRYRNAEFAADLAQVARGAGELEYRDPVEFFNRTYVTEGMKGLLVQSLRRVCGLDGEPVIQLKTAFGGGKTHSMLALYHMMRSSTRVEQIPNLKTVIDEAGVSEIPEVHVATLVGTALNPAVARRPSNMPGITINTLWGEMAYQLASSTGNPKLYDYVKEADKKSVSPGSEAITNLFDECGCCLVLMDELVAYAKKLDGATGLPAGTLDNFITFIQELTEAARASKCSLVVASIPESDNEIGGEAGQRALDQIEHTFGRMEAIWKPVGASEGFEVVRRRLFLNCKNEAAREEVCSAFSKMYNENASEFPIDSRELEYRDRMISCYPIHPEVFDRLYEDWATLERFQRTRGVLRLMAAVIHELWMNQDPAPMIMPGSFPLDVSSVRDELTRYLDDNWNGVVDSEIDGKQSIPYRKDAENGRYGALLASRRVARTVMLGSAPDVAGTNVRGIELAEIRLGTVQPGENISVFNDALGTLKSSSSFLYSDVTGNRYWYDTRPTLRKVAEDRAQQVSDSDALYEISERLKKLHKVEPFMGLHICPNSTLDVPDAQELRLVIFPPDVSHRTQAADSSAMKLAKAMVAERGTTPRNFKNMIVFCAADSSNSNALIVEAKRYKAWKSIKDDSVSLNLDAAQNRETEANISRTNTQLDAKIAEAYSWLIVPRIDLANSAREVLFDAERIAGSGESIVQKAARSLLSSEAAIKQWAPALLKMELDNLLWRENENIEIKTLWTYICSHCYLPRLANYGVLEEAIKRGLESEEYFGIAAGYSDGRYMDLSLGKPRAFINQSDYLVKPEVAKRQIALDEEAKRIEAARAAGVNNVDDWIITETNTEANPVVGTDGAQAKEASDHRVEVSAAKTSFHMATKLDNARVSRDMMNIMSEVVKHISDLDGADVELTLEVKAKVSDGIPTPTIRTVSENCTTLNIKDFRFE